MNLSNYAQTIVLYQSTESNAASTGVALALSTAGSSGTGATTSGPGGFPVTSTGTVSSVAIANYEGVRFTAAIQQFTTGAGANSSGIYTLQAYFSPGSTFSSTTWVAIQGAYALGYTTGGGSAGAGSTLGGYIQVDVYRPRLGSLYTAIGAIVQVPSSSGMFTLWADRYGARKLSVVVASTGVYGLASGAPTTGGPLISVNGST